MKELTIKRLSIVTPGIFADRVPAWLDADGVEFHSIDEVNWKDYPYAPKVQFRIAHTGKHILLQYQVTEQNVCAIETHDGGRVWEDSCCEFFVEPECDGLYSDRPYYNLECNCIGTVLLNCGVPGNRQPAPERVLHEIYRWTSLGRTPIDRRDEECSWQLALIIPVSMFFRHPIHDLSGLHMRGNFYKCGDLLPVPHFLSWNPIDLPKPNFHCPDFFGKLIFE